MTIIMSSAHSPTSSVTSPMSQLILHSFRRSTYVTDHSPTLPLLHPRHSSFSNPSFVSPTSLALHLRHLARRTWSSELLIPREISSLDLWLICIKSVAVAWSEESLPSHPAALVRFLCVLSCVVLRGCSDILQTTNFSKAPHLCIV